MKTVRIFLVAAFVLFLFLDSSWAQGRRGSTGKRIKEMTVVISEVDEAVIGYQIERRGRLRTKYIGIASVTRITKDGKSLTIKDLVKTDKVIVTLFQDPEDPYFPALSVKVIGKGELKKRARKGKKKKS